MDDESWAEIFVKMFFKLIFVLKLCVQAGCFEYNKRYKQSFLKSEDFPHEPQKHKIAGKLELIGTKGFSFR